MFEKSSDMPLGAASETASTAASSAASESSSANASASAPEHSAEADAKASASATEESSQEASTNAADSLLSEIAGMASEGARQGRKDAEEMAEKAIPAIKLGLEKASYSTGYYLTFGLVFTGKLLVDALPSTSALRQGMSDGSAAAHEAFALRKEKEEMARAFAEGSAAS